VGHSIYIKDSSQLTLRKQKPDYGSVDFRNGPTSLGTCFPQRRDYIVGYTFSKCPAPVTQGRDATSHKHRDCIVVKAFKIQRAVSQESVFFFKLYHYGAVYTVSARASLCFINKSQFTPYKDGGDCSAVYSSPFYRIIHCIQAKVIPTMTHILKVGACWH